MGHGQKNILVVLATGAFLTPLAASSPWKIDATGNLGAVVNSYSDSWVGGNSGSFTWSAQFLGIADKQFSNWLNTQTTLKLQYGQTEVQNNVSHIWSLPQKSVDLIDGQELLRFTCGWWADPFASVRLISQFKDQSDTLLTRYINPINITEAIGMDKTLRKTPTLTWSTRAGLAMQQYINQDVLVDTATGRRSTQTANDGGVEVDMHVNASNAKKWASLLSDLRVYEAIVSTQEGQTTGPAGNGDWRIPRVDWENTASLTFAKYLMLNMSVFLVYTTQQSRELQVQETLSAGLTYTFSKNKTADTAVKNR
jgi:hypothetical protein